jgi:hypothetical protein
MAISEATAMARKNKEITFKALRSAMRIEDPRILESMHKNYILGTIPAKPYPIEAAIQTAIDEVSLANPQLKNKKPEEFLDMSILKELEGEGFFERIYR